MKVFRLFVFNKKDSMSTKLVEAEYMPSHWKDFCLVGYAYWTG